MKTTAIRKALEHLRDNEAYGIGAEDIRAMAEDALAELRTLDERAATLAWNEALTAVERQFDTRANKAADENDTREWGACIAAAGIVRALKRTT